MSSIFTSVKIFIRKVFFKIFKRKKKNDFDSIAFPIIARVFARTISNDLVSVQPLGTIPEPENVYSRKVLTEKTKHSSWNLNLSTPTGLLFYLDYKYVSAETRTVITEKFKQPIDFQEDYFIPMRTETECII